MAEKKEIYLTSDGLEEMKRELEYLKMEKRPEVIQSLKEARALGDLSENAEYDAARGAQAEVESKIKELESMIEHAVVISENKSGKISIGSKVTIKYVDDNEEEEYTIVGSKESDPFSNKISNESPIGQALLGRKVNEIVDVHAPVGILQFKILAIKK
jgi:transcription elongation factor GreA